MADSLTSRAADKIAAGLECYDRALYIKTGWIRDPHIIFPLDISVDSEGEVHVRAVDPDYFTPGPEEVQKF